MLKQIYNTSMRRIVHADRAVHNKQCSESPVSRVSPKSFRTKWLGPKCLVSFWPAAATSPNCHVYRLFTDVVE